MRVAEEQAQHDRMIALLVTDLKKRGYQRIRASHLDGFEDLRPERIPGEESGEAFRPDIYAEKDGYRFIFEVETADSIGEQHTARELRAFATGAAREDHFLYLVVPDGIREQAQALLNQITVRSLRRSFVLTL